MVQEGTGVNGGKEVLGSLQAQECKSPWKYKNMQVAEGTLMQRLLVFVVTRSIGGAQEQTLKARGLRG